jgi:radical SAM protein with 4Fe4S-binding SPASM domain
MITEQKKGEFLTSLVMNAPQKRLPISGSIEITYQCNNNCVHCYTKPFESAESQLETGKILELINEFADCGCMFLLLTGGEPLLHPDFEKIYIHAKDRGLLVNINTNGRLLADFRDLFLEYPPFSVEVSLYGLDRDTYKQVAGTDFDPQALLDLILFFREKGHTVDIKAMALKPLMKQIPEMSSWAQEHGLDFRFDTVVHSTLEHSPINSDFKLRIEDLLNLEGNDYDVRCAYLKLYNEKGDYSDIGDKKLFSCGAGHESFHVDAFGNLHPCILYRGNPYDLNKGDFKTGFYRHLRLLREKLVEYYECMDCDLRYVCQHCTGHSWINLGNDIGVTKWICDLNKKRINYIKEEQLQ